MCVSATEKVKERPREREKNYRKIVINLHTLNSITLIEVS